MTNRIYAVSGGEKLRLIRAPNAAQAIRHIAKPYKAEMATQEQLVKALGEGVQIEDAKSDDTTE